jgi:hypothetical protein
MTRRRERKEREKQKNQLEPNHYSSVYMQGTNGNTMTRHFKHRLKKWCLKVGRRHTCCLRIPHTPSNFF